MEQRVGFNGGRKKGYRAAQSGSTEDGDHSDRFGGRGGMSAGLGGSWWWDGF